MTIPLSDDLAYVRSVTADATATPSLSGRHSAWWAALTVLAFVGHWAALSGYGPLTRENLGLLWIGYGVIGGIGAGIIGYTLRNKPGQGFVGNRVEATAWPVTAVGIFLYAFAIGFAVGLRDVPVILFDTIVGVALLAHAINYAAAATTFQSRWRWLPVGLSLAGVAGAAFLVGLNALYLFAAVMVVLIWLVPGLTALRNEPRDVEPEQA